MKRIILGLLLALSAPGLSFANCEKVQGGNRTPFTETDTLGSMSVDKAARDTLNKTFPKLEITKGIFSGKIQTCTGADCKDNFVTCK